MSYDNHKESLKTLGEIYNGIAAFDTKTEVMRIKFDQVYYGESNPLNGCYGNFKIIGVPKGRWARRKFFQDEDWIWKCTFILFGMNERFSYSELNSNKVSIFEGNNIKINGIQIVSKQELLLERIDLLNKKLLEMDENRLNSERSINERLTRYKDEQDAESYKVLKALTSLSKDLRAIKHNHITYMATSKKKSTTKPAAKKQGKKAGKK